MKVQRGFRIQNLNFKSIPPSFIRKQIKSMNVKKVTAYDKMSVNMLKISAKSSFPVHMKIAQVVPIYKKNSILDKSNYRPDCLLPLTSKIFERDIYQQLMGGHKNKCS